jgi:hypothetical protein
MQKCFLCKHLLHVYYTVLRSKCDNTDKCYYNMVKCFHVESIIIWMQLLLSEQDIMKKSENIICYFYCFHLI